ncbi:hypothetical protein D9615_010115 [Tricholomella constricta]|uniref:Uncharacterized protein n=1 Tax=Tricholomella constricta TaxID=117010 RepID=A0A8H5GXH6_9AGAR|nr:hypothetical protein D9615_010115 [Tricholomella constricta]
MPARLTRLLVCVALLSCLVLAVQDDSESDEKLLSVTVLETEVQACVPVQKLSVLKEALVEGESPILRQVFAWLFPFGPAWNSILGTFYISSVPNFILAFIPAEIHGDTLNTMTAFATGGLLSDVFLHLIPHSFMGEHQGSGVHFVMVEEKRNILIGLGIFIGFATFFFMEKTLRVLGGEDGATGHSHSRSHHVELTSAHASGANYPVSHNGLRSRKSEKIDTPATPPQQASGINGPSKLSAYLNLFGDFVHNITDGLAMAASFYASPLIGATTTLACFAHEIPHEIADYSILIRSGFTKKQAMQSQFLTAIGAFVGCVSSISINTFIGIAVHTATASNVAPEATNLAAGVRQDATGLLGTTAQWSDLVLPFVAGGFLYIGAVAVLPTLLAESKSGKQAFREFGAMAFGVVFGMSRRDLEGFSTARRRLIVEAVDAVVAELKAAGQAKAQVRYLFHPPRLHTSSAPTDVGQTLKSASVSFAPSASSRPIAFTRRPLIKRQFHPFSFHIPPPVTLGPHVYLPECPRSLHPFTDLHSRQPPQSFTMGTKGRSVPRIVCCAIPIARAAGKILVVTSRKRPDSWCRKVDGNRRMCSWRLQPRERPWKKVLPVPLSVSSSPDALPSPPRYLSPALHTVSLTAGVRGTITRFVITIPTPSTIYHFYELDVAGLDQDWLERHERRREWVDYAEAVRRLEWKSELAQGLKLSSLAPVRSR